MARQNLDDLRRARKAAADTMAAVAARIGALEAAETPDAAALEAETAAFAAAEAAFAKADAAVRPNASPARCGSAFTVTPAGASAPSSSRPRAISARPRLPGDPSPCLPPPPPAATF
ncbi:hypothetical protein DWF04_004215 [Cereibacter sphaeroides f. sp. denitrificans]